jgi:hypothetical protein
MTTTTDDRTVGFTAYIDRPVDEVATLLMASTAVVIAGGERGHTDRIVVPLEVPMGQHGSARRPAVVSVGPAEAEDGCLRLPLRITALDNERWFPTFEGALTVESSQFCESTVRMNGEYRLPLGALGRATGSLGGDKAALTALYALFLEVIAGVEREMRETGPRWRPAPVSTSLRDEDRPRGG